AAPVTALISESLIKPVIETYQAPQTKNWRNIMMPRRTVFGLNMIRIAFSSEAREFAGMKEGWPAIVHQHEASIVRQPKRVRKQATLPGSFPAADLEFARRRRTSLAFHR